MKEVPKINFKCFIPNVINNFPIKKTKPFDFKWFKKAVDDYKFNKPVEHTSKCPGIISILNFGWIQYSYQDFTIETNGDKESFKWSSEIDQKSLPNGDLMQDYISYHSKDQLEKYKNFPNGTLHTIIKIQSPWVVEIPHGYKLLSMPIPYNDDNRFIAAHGILKDKNWLNIQLFWYKTNSKEFVKKGTPLCQYLLIREEEADFVIDVINEEDKNYLKKIKLNYESK
jgi:hypothetical protein